MKKIVYLLYLSLAPLYGLTQDTLGPSINCPPDTIVFVSEESCSQTVTWELPTPTDSSGVKDFTWTHDSGYEFPIGTSLVIFTATDSLDNVSTCSTSIEIKDTIKPTLLYFPNDTTLHINDSLCGAYYFPTPPLAQDNCDSILITHNLPTNFFFPLGENVITYQFSDTSGNSIDTSLRVMVLDTKAPQLVCDEKIELFTTEECTSQALWPSPIILDNCTLVDTSVSISQGTLLEVGEHEVFYSATDISGNTGFCKIDVIVKDTVAPIADYCNTDTTFYLSPDQCEKEITWHIPSFSDNCALFESPKDSLHTATLSAGEYPFSYPAQDVNGNQKTCQLDVIVKDTVSPIWDNCPSDIQAYTPTKRCTDPIEWAVPEVTENCKLDTLIVSHQPGERFGAGFFSVEYIAIDQSNNVDSCLFTVEVIDTVSPTVDAPDTLTLSLLTDTCVGVVEWDFKLKDNCSIDTIISNIREGDSLAVGVYSVSMEVADPSGNSTISEFILQFLDRTAPVITCPEAIITCDPVVLYDTVSVFDNCSLTSIEQTTHPDLFSGATFPVGTSIIRYRATDAYGNFSECDLHVSVLSEAFAGTDTNAIICWDEIEADNILNLNTDYLPTGAPLGGHWHKSFSTGEIVNGHLHFNKYSLLPGTYELYYTVSPEGCSETDTATVALQVNMCVGTNDVYDTHLKVFPNPANDALHLQNTTGAELMVEIFTLSGRSIFRENLRNQLTISLERWPKGIYMLKAKNHHLKIVRK